MNTFVRVAIKQKYQDSVRDVRHHMKLYFRNFDNTTVRYMTIKYSLSELPTKLLGNSRTVNTVYGNAFICSPEVRHNLFNVGNRASMMHFLLLRLVAHLPSATHCRTGLAAR